MARTLMTAEAMFQAERDNMLGLIVRQADLEETDLDPAMLGDALAHVIGQMRACKIPAKKILALLEGSNG